MSEQTAVSTLALQAETAGTDTQWVHLLPLGSFDARDGRHYSLTNATAVIQRTLRQQGSALPVDYEHQTDFAPQNGQPAPAAGWIKSLAVRASGIWGLIQWTDRAASYIAAKEYRFISPTFQHTKDGEVTCLLRAGLTNNPALELVALAKAQNDRTPMNILDELRSLLKLPATAAPDAIVEAVRSLTEEKSQARFDPARHVPIEVLENVTAELNRVNNGLSEEAAVITVQREVERGRLLPALREWGISLCRVNKPAFDAFVEKTGANLQSLFEPTALARRGDGADHQFSEMDAAIARQLGHKPDELAPRSSSHKA